MSPLNEIEEDKVPTEKEVRQAITALQARCAAKKITFSDDTTYDGEDTDVNIDISIPSGRTSRRIYLGSYSDVVKLAEVPFEKYAVLGGYAAICCYSEGKIEAILSAPTNSKSILVRSRIRRALGLYTGGSREAKDLVLSSTQGDALEISIKNTSDLAKRVTQTNEQLNLSLTIQTVAINGHDEALALLNKVSNSLLFEIDLQLGLHLALVRFEIGKRRFIPSEQQQVIHYPKNLYDEAPMALYWYARSATSMPLLQFLAYYQVIEFYFPRFFNSAIARRIRSMIKSPSFRVENDADLARVISTVRTNSVGFGSEKDQLKATLRDCLDNQDVQAFLNEQKDRIEFFGSKVKGITSNTLNPENRSIELHTQVANRVYDIRCKIVHTKGEDDQHEIELLLPYSPEAEKLDNDIELVRYVAQKVLVCASSALDI